MNFDTEIDGTLGQFSIAFFAYNIKGRNGGDGWIEI